MLGLLCHYIPYLCLLLIMMFCVGGNKKENQKHSNSKTFELNKFFFRNNFVCGTNNFTNNT